MDAQVILASSRRVEPASWQYRYAVAQSRLRERGSVAARQAYPQSLPAAHWRRVPVRKVTGQFRAQMVVTGLPLRSPALRQRIEARQ